MKTRGNNTVITDNCICSSKYCIIWRCSALFNVNLEVAIKSLSSYFIAVSASPLAAALCVHVCSDRINLCMCVLFNDGKKIPTVRMWERLLSARSDWGAIPVLGHFNLKCRGMCDSCILQRCDCGFSDIRKGANPSGGILFFFLFKQCSFYIESVNCCKRGLKNTFGLLQHLRFSGLGNSNSCLISNKKIKPPTPSILL